MNSLAKPLLKQTYALFSRCILISALAVNLAQSGAANAQPTFGLNDRATLTFASPLPRTLEVSNGKTPADLLGEWSWTTISSVNYQNMTTNQRAAPSGMSCRFTFTRDGRYKKFFYVRMRTYSLVSESTTTEEGTVTFGDNTFTMHPEKGHYKGNTGSRLIDRPMTREERKATTYRWEWRKQEGGHRLFLGPDTQSLRMFTPAK